MALLLVTTVEHFYDFYFWFTLVKAKWVSLSSDFSIQMDRTLVDWRVGFQMLRDAYRRRFHEFGWSVHEIFKIPIDIVFFIHYLQISLMVWNVDFESQISLMDFLKNFFFEENLWNFLNQIPKKLLRPKFPYW